MKQGFLVKNLNSGKKLEYKIVDARTIEILSNGLNITEIKDNNKITSLYIQELELPIGFEFNTGSSKLTGNYKIEFIEKSKEGYTLFTHKRNLTTTYMLPMLGNTMLNTNNQDNPYASFLINAYLSEDLESIYILYRYCDNSTQGIIEEALPKINGFVKLVNPVPGLDLYEFRIPEEHLEDAVHFMKGEYSKFSPKLKSNITKFAMESILNMPLKVRPKGSPRIVQVINKDHELAKIMAKEWGCKIDYFNDLECKPQEIEEIWKQFGRINTILT